MNVEGKEPLAVGPVDLAILGGQVVTPEGVRRAGVAVAGGRVAAIAPESDLPAARERIDASGCLVLPGAIDVHLHYDRDGRVADRVGDATLSAAYGGVTAAVAFLLWQPGRRPTETVEEAAAEVEAESYLDVGFHFYLRADDFDALVEVPALVGRGVPSFKMSMAYKRRGNMCSDRFLLAAMDAIQRAGGMAMVHAESGEVIDYLEQVAIREGRVRPEHYCATRPDYTEAEAVGRAAALGAATGCPVYVVHLSSQLGVEQLLIAQRAGHNLQGETCPQYLTLTGAEMERQGPLPKIAPPLRTARDQAALWLALASGDLSIVASDHAPHALERKLSGRDDIFLSPFGAPTVETMLPLLHSEGVVRRGLSAEWLAWVSSEAPARLFGLYPRKGALQPGVDADLVVLDPLRTMTINAADLHSKAGYTPFAGITVRGWPVATVVGGRVLVREGQLVGDSGRARFLARAPLPDSLSGRLRRSGPANARAPGRNG